MPTVDTSAERESSVQTHIQKTKQKIAKENFFFGRFVLFIQNYYEIVNKKKTFRNSLCSFELGNCEKTDKQMMSGKKMTYYVFSFDHKFKLRKYTHKINIKSTWARE